MYVWIWLLPNGLYIVSAFLELPVWAVSRNNRPLDVWPTDYKPVLGLYRTDSPVAHMIYAGTYATSSSCKHLRRLVSRVVSIVCG